VCVSRSRDVRDADRASARVYLRMREGAAAWVDRAGLAAAAADDDTRAGLVAVAPRVLADDPLPAEGASCAVIDPGERAHTLGDWGEG